MEELYPALLRAGLTLDGGSVPLEIDRAQVEQFYLPLARRVLALEQPGARAAAAVAGPPGSGKSAFAALLAAAANALAGRPLAACVGMDGWHYPNAYLETHTLQREGREIPLRAVKGAPETFDALALADFLHAARAGGELPYPIYSREVHDPLPAAGRLTPAQRILILEGNYLLLDQPPWSSLRPLFDLTIFLTAGPPTLLDGLIQRHLRGGKDPALAERHARSVDLPNIHLVLEHSSPAGITVEKADGRTITSILG